MDAAQTPRVLTSEVYEIPKNASGKTTIHELVASMRVVFAADRPRVERMLYERGRPLLVERFGPPRSDGAGEETPDVLDAFLTPYQMVRQHADLDVQEDAFFPLEALARAAQSLAERDCTPSMLVCRRGSDVRTWTKALAGLRVEDIWQIPLIEDPEVDPERVYLAGSASGRKMIRDITAAVQCSMRGDL